MKNLEITSHEVIIYISITRSKQARDFYLLIYFLVTKFAEIIIQK